MIFFVDFRLSLPYNSKRREDVGQKKTRKEINKKSNFLLTFKKASFIINSVKRHSKRKEVNKMKEKKMTWDEMELLLVDREIATRGEIDIVCCINGWTEKSMEDILYVRCGYRDFEQLENE